MDSYLPMQKLEPVRAADTKPSPARLVHDAAQCLSCLQSFLIIAIGDHFSCVLQHVDYLGIPKQWSRCACCMSMTSAVYAGAET